MRILIQPIIEPIDIANRCHLHIWKQTNQSKGQGITVSEVTKYEAKYKHERRINPTGKDKIKLRFFWIKQI